MICRITAIHGEAGIEVDFDVVDVVPNIDLNSQANSTPCVNVSVAPIAKLPDLACATSSVIQRLAKAPELADAPL
jgi:hypothetical protein